MRPCPACGSAIDPAARFCAACGASTAAPPPDATQTSLGLGGAPSVPKAARERFLPGTVLAGRYRIVGPVGRGGMGQVYRADDLKLGQSVALKFLPEAFERDPGRLERLLAEVRVARQVSHANVCRVYDVAEADSRHFISMEFVDGEDLGSLLRRIGRLPADKGVELARQICAGLAAAHEQGILHRDLKPANVMIDGRGRAKIADFGLAALAEEVLGAEIRSGTPAYMAPEQRAGREVSVRSDLYALGLVLYEMLTGRAAFASDSAVELDRLQRETRPPTPTSVVDGLDPALERAILRCLEPVPGDRPASALAVAAALPGGDPLAAALAAGETPSPEMVAAAGGGGALRPAVAIGLLLLFFAALAVYAVLSQASLLARTRPEKPPEVLAERARQVARALGHADPAGDEAWGFDRNADAVRWRSSSAPAPERWQRLGDETPRGIVFWYRSSPRPMVAEADDGRVGYFDPPPLVAGMTWVVLDPAGHLQTFLSQQPPEDLGPAPDPARDWAAVFELAGLDLAAFVPDPARRNPLTFAEARHAWHRVAGDDLRVEAATHQGRVTFFTVVGPWTRPARTLDARGVVGPRLGSILYVLFTAIAVVVAAVLARKNVLAGRGDRRGAFRLAVYLLIVEMAVWLLRADHASSVTAEWSLVERAMGGALVRAGLVWLFYLAAEPFVRRRWPESLIGWTRLLSGRCFDPRVGREVLIGAVLGTILGCVIYTWHYVSQALGSPEPVPPASGFDLLLGPRRAIAWVLSSHLGSLSFGMLLFFFLFLGIAGWRARWAGVTLFLAISTGMAFLFFGNGPLGLRLVIAGLWAVLIAALFLRAGLLGAATGLTVSQGAVPLLAGGATWVAAATVTVWIVFAALAVYGCRTALRQRSGGAAL